jgi:hypothetical protein
VAVPPSKNSTTYTSTETTISSTYERLIAAPETHLTLFDESYIDDGTGTLSQPYFGEQKTGETYMLSCSFCEGPMEVILLTKNYETLYQEARATEFSYSIRSKECDCPIAVFTHNFVNVRVIDET